MNLTLDLMRELHERQGAILAKLSIEDQRELLLIEAQLRAGKLFVEGDMVKCPKCGQKVPLVGIQNRLVVSPHKFQMMPGVGEPQDCEMSRQVL